MFPSLKMKPVTAEYRKFVGDLKTVDVAPKMLASGAVAELDAEKIKKKATKKFKKKHVYKVPCNDLDNMEAALDMFK